MGTLSRQAEIGVWVQALGHFCRGLGYYPRKNFDTVYAKSCNL